MDDTIPELQKKLAYNTRILRDECYMMTHEGIRHFPMSAQMRRFMLATVSVMKWKLAVLRSRQERKIIELRREVAILLQKSSMQHEISERALEFFDLGDLTLFSVKLKYSMERLFV